MLLNHGFELLDIVLIFHLLNGNHILIQIPVEMAVLVQHIGDTAAHACRKVFAGSSKNHHPAAGHILTAVLAHALNHCIGAGIADGKPLSGHAVYKDLSAGCAVEGYISGNDIFLRLVATALRRINDKGSAGKPLSKVIVGISAEGQGQALGNKGAKALASGSRTGYGNGILRQSLLVASGDLRPQNGSEGPVRIAHLELHRRLLALLQAGFQLFQKNTLIQGTLQLEIIALGGRKGHRSLHVSKGIVQDLAQIKLGGHGRGSPLLFL